MLNSRWITLQVVLVTALCCHANAQLELDKIATLGNFQERTERFSGGRSIAINDDGTKLIAAFYGSRVQLFDIESRQAIGSPISTAGDGLIGFLNDKIAYTADWESLNFWDAASGESIGLPIPHELREDTIIRPAVSPVTRRIATRPHMHSVQLWDAETRQQVGHSIEFSSEVRSTRFSTDGKILFVSAGRSLNAYDSISGEEITGAIPSEGRYYHYSGAQVLVSTEAEDSDNSNRLVFRSTDQPDWPEIARIKIPGKLKRIAKLKGDQILVQSTRPDFRPSLILLSLSQPTITTTIDTQADRAFHLLITEDQTHWISSNIRNIRCQRFGHAEPEWEYTVPPSGYDQRLYPFDKHHFAIRDRNNQLGVFRISDARPVWNHEEARSFLIDQGRVFVCNSQGVEIWEVR